MIYLCERLREDIHLVTSLVDQSSTLFGVGSGEVAVTDVVGVVAVVGIWGVVCVRSGEVAVTDGISAAAPPK